MPHTTPPRSAAARTPVPLAGHCWPMPPQETIRQTDAGLAQSLVGVMASFPQSWCTQGFVCALQVSLVCLWFYFKCNCAPPPDMLRLLFCPWMWGIFFWWDAPFSWAFLVAQTVKNLTAMQEIWVLSLCQEDPLEEDMTIHISILACRIPWTEEPGGLQSMGPQKVEHNWVTKHTTITTFSRWWFFSSQLPFWCSHRRRWLYILLPR